MANQINYSYHGKFEGNILIVARTGCGKTTFVQNLGKNRMLGDTKAVVCVLKIALSKDREDNIRDCFIIEKTDFQYRNSKDEFDDLLDYVQRQKAPCNENYLEENMLLDRLIVMDEVSSLVDHLDNFLMVSQKNWNYVCICVPHNLPDETKLANDSCTNKNT